MIDKSLLAVVIASREAMHEKTVKECRDRYLCSTFAEMAGRSFMFYPLVIFSLFFAYLCHGAGLKGLVDCFDPVRYLAVLDRVEPQAYPSC